jgi:hypothetical protein
MYLSAKPKPQPSHSDDMDFHRVILRDFLELHARGRAGGNGEVDLKFPSPFHRPFYSLPIKMSSPDLTERSNCKYTCMPKKTNIYIEEVPVILVLSEFMRGKVLRPNTQQFFVLASGFNVWLDCRPDAPYLILGNDHTIFRTYRLEPILQPSTGRRGVKWILIDALDFRVRYLYAVNGVPGSYHELGIRHHYKGSRRSPKYLRGLEPKIDDGREMIKLRHHRPRYMHQETFVKILLKFRGVPAERLIEETTAAVTEWDASHEPIPLAASFRPP